MDFLTVDKTYLETNPNAATEITLCKLVICWLGVMTYDILVICIK